jgi:hypothetical protein
MGLTVYPPSGLNRAIGCVDRHAAVRILLLLQEFAESPSRFSMGCLVAAAIYISGKLSGRFRGGVGLYSMRSGSQSDDNY